MNPSAEHAAARRRLPLVLLGNALMRISGGATGVLVGLYLAHLANHGLDSGAALAGSLGAIAFGTELVGAIPMGLVSDALAPRSLMTAGAVLGAAATQLFGMTDSPSIFFLSRAVEGLGASASAPSLLAHLTDTTDGDPPLRARVMSYFELSLLAGLALGAVFAGELWRRIGPGAFSAVAGSYLLAAALLYLGSVGSRGYGVDNALEGFRRALREPSLRRLAPIWLCVNSIVSLWLGPPLSFLFTQRSSSGQFLAGLFADAPHQVGWVMLGYSIVFGTGVTAWSFVLPRMNVLRALRIALLAMFGACIGLYALNHSAQASTQFRWIVGACTAACVMVESGFTPAALSLLAGAVGAQAGRGAAMGIYSVLLSLGAIIGSLLAGWLGAYYSIDGLIHGTVAMAVVALVLVRRMGT
jgi:MFS family permease